MSCSRVWPRSRRAPPSKGFVVRGAVKPTLQQELRDSRRGVADAAWSTFASLALYVLRDTGSDDDAESLTELQKQVLELLLADVERSVAHISELLGGVFAEQGRGRAHRERRVAPARAQAERAGSAPGALLGQRRSA
jgi:hypothetical protein